MNMKEKRDRPAGWAGFGIGILITNSKPPPPILDQLSNVFPPPMNQKHLDGDCFVKLRKWRQWQCKLPPTFPVVLALFGWFQTLGTSGETLAWLSGMYQKFWQDSIIFATFWLNSITCLRMWHRNALLDQQPINIIINIGHLSMYIVMAAPDLIKCVPTSSSFTPNVTSLIATTVSLNASIIWEDVTWSMIPFNRTFNIGEFLDETGYLIICRLMAAAALTGYRRRSSDAINDTVSIFLSFFWHSK